MQQPRISRQVLEDIARERVPVAGEMGLSVDRIEVGEVVVRVPFRDSYLRPGGTIAGPVMMTLADFAMYGVVLSLIGPVELAVTTSFNVNFLRRPAPGDVVAVARILKLGKRLAVMEASVFTAGDDDMVAHATGTYSIPPVNDS